MNDPTLADERHQMVRRAKDEGVPKEEAWTTIQHDWSDNKFEGHHLRTTIERVYE